MNSEIIGLYAYFAFLAYTMLISEEKGHNEMNEVKRKRCGRLDLANYYKTRYLRAAESTKLDGRLFATLAEQKAFFTRKAGEYV